MCTRFSVSLSTLGAPTLPQVLGERPRELTTCCSPSPTLHFHSTFSLIQGGPAGTLLITASDIAASCGSLTRKHPSPELEHLQTAKSEVSSGFKPWRSKLLAARMTVNRQVAGKWVNRGVDL